MPIKCDVFEILNLHCMKGSARLIIEATFILKMMYFRDS